MKSYFFFTKYKLIHFNQSFKKFSIKTIINLKKMCLIFNIDIGILKLQINTKLKTKLHVKKLQNKTINQLLKLTELIVFT